MKLYLRLPSYGYQRGIFCILATSSLSVRIPTLPNFPPLLLSLADEGGA